jgi:hypothetical protein
MAEIYTAARTLAELSSAGIPAIQSPLPGVADSHYPANARLYSTRPGAKFVSGKEWDKTLLASWIESLLSDPDLLRTMSERTRSRARPGLPRQSFTPRKHCSTVDRIQRVLRALRAINTAATPMARTSTKPPPMKIHHPSTVRAYRNPHKCRIKRSLGKPLVKIHRTTMRLALGGFLEMVDIGRHGAMYLRLGCSHPCVATLDQVDRTNHYGC